MSLFDFFRSPRRAPVRTSSSEVWQFQGKPVRLVLRPRRRRISVELKPHQPITVRGPMSLSKRQAERFLLEKWDWIEKHWERIEKIPPALALDFSREVHMWIAGVKRPLQMRITQLRRPCLATDVSGEPILFLPEKTFRDENLRRALLTPAFSEKLWRKFLRKSCQLRLLDRVQELALQMSVRPQRVRFRHMRSRWGSCTSRGAISLNSRLAAAPAWVADAVIVHELSHLEDMNHGKSFWERVARFAPRYKDADRWLEAHSPEIP